MRNDAEWGRRARRTPWGRHLRRATLALAALAAAAGAAAFGYEQFAGAEKPELRTVTVTVGDVESAVTALGTLQPRDYVDVGTQVSGQLRTLHVEIGDRVVKGQLLAEIDATVYESRVKADRAKLVDLQAQLRQRRAELELARQQNARNHRLYDARAISQDELQTGEAKLAVAEAVIASLDAQINQAQSTLEGDIANLGYTKIHAPIGGTVVSLSAVEGQTLNANQTAPIVLRIADLQTMTVKAQVAEADIVRIEAGMPVYFTTLGTPERKWRSAVRQILPTPEVVNDVVLYNALIDIENAGGVLMSNMTAQVFFILGEARQVPTVPLSVLRPRGGDRYSVTVLGADGTTRVRTVEVSLANRTTAAIASGLESGERVVHSPAHRAAGRQGGDRPAGLSRIRL